MKIAPRRQTSKDRLLGMDREITRRDFLNATLLGTGGALLYQPAPLHARPHQVPQPSAEVVPNWGGYGGIGDYANSYGNTEPVVRAAHAIRNGAFDEVPTETIDTGEEYDLVVVGGGFSGLGAAYEFKRSAKSDQTCLILDNHPIFGGEAKRNEFMVDGYRLIGPQGSNATVVPTGPDHPLDEYHRTLGIPTEFEFQTWDRQKFKPLDFARDHYAFMFWGDRSDSVGYFFDEASEGGPRWATNIWEKGLEDTPYTEAVRRDLLACRASQKKPYSGDDFEAWLDTMTYQHYLENVLGHGPEMAAYMSPILASGLALGSDALSAYRCYAVGAPGFGGFTAQAGRGNTALADHPWFAFPGGNAGLARFFMKWLIPESIQGTKKLNDVVCGRVNFAALDRGGQSVRVRLGATAVRVEHDRSPGTGERVRVTYIVDGKPYTVWARGVVMASASGVNRYVVRDAPAKFQEAWRHFHYASMLVVNVALTNWRFLYKLGITTCRWFNGFGFSANLRRSMIMDDYRPPLDPDKPTVLTLNIPFINPGRPVEEQGQMARLELLSTPYVDYERKLRQELAAMFASAGFDPARDIAGLVLNRWGHAYVVPGPGFHFGRDGKPTAADVVREGYGRIAFGHSELRGHQYWYGGVEEGRRAAKQALKAAFS